ncbi:N-acetylneuraminate 9-O-acetyltransferase [Schistosoma japonicum]|uniref:N-acetylneuraminate 9-O-acetyltransferase n=1 Tax=Schistosoma japonicum TaxID=6182 RepID=A0A4Z2CPN5_SCHJA|nr:N-acetylneuraminate 9-O-acetyltransferase [Schistosoma japonicum]
MSSARAASAIKEVINFKNAKRISFILMIIISIYHGFLMTKSGGNLCKSLLSDGRSGPSGEFQPYSCMIHTYLSRDSHKCFKRLAPWGDVVRLYFVGDSRLKKLFNAFVYHVNDEGVGENTTSEANISNSYQYLTGEVDLRFFYHDEITDDTLELIKSWIGSTNLTTVTDLHMKNKKIDISTPTHLIISMGTKTIQHYNRSEDGLLEYMNGVKRLTGVLEELKFARSVWMLQDPVAEGLLSKELKIITNDLIDKYNELASTAMKSVSGVEIWSSNRLIALRVGFPTINWNCRQSHMAFTSNSDKMTSAASLLDYKEGISKNNVCPEMPVLSDGYHVSDKAMKENVQILLNLYCNNQMKFSDGTCCRGSEQITPVQQKCFIFYAICVLSTLLCFMYSQFISHGKLYIQLINLRRIFSPFRKAPEAQPYILMENESSSDNTNGDNDDNNDNHNNSDNNDTTNSLFVEFYELTSALSKFGAIMMYFFICDRTILFMKANKRYTNLSFFLPIIYCFVLGLFFSGPTKRTQVNHVDITREWKGWMQLYLLIYHFTDSYRVTPIFMSARLVVSSYLFLSGYGHFCYFGINLYHKLYRCCSRELCIAWNAFWQILHRYLIVIYRFNFFVFGLCLVMNRGYLAYYFIPLVSFWFTIVLIVCVMFPRVSGQKVSGNKNTHDDVIHHNSNNNNHDINNDGSTHTDSVINVVNTTTASITATTIIPITTAFTSATSTTVNSYDYNRYNFSNQHCFTTVTNINDEYLPNQYIESDDEVYFHQSPARSSRSMKKPLLLPNSSSSTPSTFINDMTDMMSDYIPCSSSSSTTATLVGYNIPKGHYKALSLGTGFDLCQNYSLSSATADNTTLSNAQFHHCKSNQKLVGHRSHRSIVKSLGRFGPPLTEGLLRKFRCNFVVPLKMKMSSTASTPASTLSTTTANKKRQILSHQKSKQSMESTKFCGFLNSKLFAHCSRIRLVYVIMIIKYIGLICLIELLYRSRAVFHWLFFSGPQKYLFQYHREYAPDRSSTQEVVVNNDEQIWFYRWSMDRYSAIYGMIFAFLCESLRQIGILNDSDNEGPSSMSDATVNYLQGTKQSNVLTGSNEMHRLPLRNNSSNNVHTNNVKYSNDNIDDNYNKQLQTDYKPVHYQIDYNDQSSSILNRSYDYLNQQQSHSASCKTKRNHFVSSTIQCSNRLRRPMTNLSCSSSSSLNHLNEYKKRCYLSVILCKFFSPLGLTILGVIGLMFSCMYVFACSNRETCLRIHPYMCLIPILSYILVRNSFRSLRRMYSIFFAWIGDMSLEVSCDMCLTILSTNFHTC